jgi:PAS domain S-box-containing protein
VFRRSNFGIGEEAASCKQRYPPGIWRFACALGQAFLRQRYGAILEAKLAETNGRFRLLVEGVRDYALFTMDPTGSVTSWNGGAERMLGYVEAEIVGRISLASSPGRYSESRARETATQGFARQAERKMRDGASGRTGSSSGPMSTSQHCWKMRVRFAALPSSCKT